jgi:hypothetical protein
VELLGGAGERGPRGWSRGRDNMQDWEGRFGKVGAVGWNGERERAPPLNAASPRDERQDAG